MTITLVVVAIVLAIDHSLGRWAQQHGRSYAATVLASILISPILVGIYLAVVIRRRPAFGGDAGMAPDPKTCPDCAETVLDAARVCKHCGYRFATAE